MKREDDGAWVAWQEGPPGWLGMVVAGHGPTKDDMMRNVIDRALASGDWIMGDAEGKWTVGETHKPWKHLVAEND